MVGSKIDLLCECVAFIQRVSCKKTDLGVDEVGIYNIYFCLWLFNYLLIMFFLTHYFLIFFISLCTSYLNKVKNYLYVQHNHICFLSKLF